MELVNGFIDIIMHLDKHLEWFFSTYGTLTYFLVFTIIFCETGLVVTPFLPGDSLLFAIGAFCAISTLNLTVMLILLPVAAIIGDNLNYWIGYWAGPKVFNKEKSKFFNKENINKAHGFYEKYGGIAITLCRFIPIFRTYVPFVSGIAKMTFWKFTFWNVLGGVSWTLSFLLLGYFFGNMPIVKNNFQLVILGIIIISVLPVVIEVLKKMRENKSKVK
jgi:membrane-associated protein